MIRTIGRLAALVAGGFVCTRAVADPDLWWHLKAGLDLLQTRHLTAVDPYSFTQDVPWINHEWLSELVMALAYRAGAVPGLLFLKIALLGATLMLVARALQHTEDSVRWWLLTAAIVALNFSATTIRPQLWTLLGVALALRATSWRHGMYWLPLIFAAWANMHGGWIVGFAAVAAWLAGRALDTRSLRAVLPGALTLLAALGATLLNPYGWGLWNFLLSTVRITRNLTEWQPVWRQEGLSMLIVWSLIAVGVVGTTLVRRRDTLTWAGVLPVIWLGLTSLLVTRLVPIFGEAAVLCLAAAWHRTPHSAPSTRHGTLHPAPSTAPGTQHPAPGTRLIDSLVVAAVCASLLWSETRCFTATGEWAPDLEAASAFDASDLHGRLVLPYDWGGYAIWYWGPRLRVSIDPRRETVYSELTVATASAVRRGAPEGLAFLDRSRPEYVWLPAASATVGAWLRSNGYRVDIETGRSFIATRSDVSPLRLGAPKSGCFP